MSEEHRLREYSRPTVAEVERIAALADPVLRNLQITQCYCELSQVLMQRTGPNANWCTFATWASKQAGQSIRKEDLRRMLERALRDPATLRQAPAEAAALNLSTQSLAVEAERLGIRREPAKIQAAAWQAVDLRLAVDRASEAVARGNHKVFGEIGREFARFMKELFEDEHPNPEKLERFCAGLRPGEPPEGQRYLRQAFTRYYRSFFVTSAKERAELLLCANLEIGFHEQTRLQPEIAEALDAGFIDMQRFARAMFAALFPFSGWLALAQWRARRLLGRETPFDRALQRWQAAAQVMLRRALTEWMMTISLSPGVLVRMGDDLSAGFPEALRDLANPDLLGLLAQLDPTPDSPAESGARDWADLFDRLHFIADLFRGYQETPDLFIAPFTPEQTAALKAGRRPAGRL